MGLVCSSEVTYMKMHIFCQSCVHPASGVRLILWGEAHRCNSRFGCNACQQEVHREQLCGLQQPQGEGSHCCPNAEDAPSQCCRQGLRGRSCALCGRVEKSCCGSLNIRHRAWGGGIWRVATQAGCCRVCAVEWSWIPNSMKFSCHTRDVRRSQNWPLRSCRHSVWMSCSWECYSITLLGILQTCQHHPFALLSQKTAFLVDIASARRVSELAAFFIAELCVSRKTGWFVTQFFHFVLGQLGFP